MTPAEEIASLKADLEECERKLAAKTEQHAQYKRAVFARMYGAAPNGLRFGLESTPGQAPHPTYPVPLDFVGPPLCTIQDDAQKFLEATEFFGKKWARRHVTASRERSVPIPTCRTPAPVVHLALPPRDDDSFLYGRQVHRLACSHQVHVLVAMTYNITDVSCPVCHDSPEWQTAMADVLGWNVRGMSRPTQTEPPLAELAQPLPLLRPDEDTVVYLWP